MAAGGSEILREYLLSLGFKVNTNEERNFTNSLKKTNKLAIGVGTSLVSAGAAVVAMTQQYANSMEKLYYASRRTNSTVGNIQAMEFAAGQVGVSAGAIRQSIEGMAKVLRNSPGMQTLLESFGVPVRGRDMSDVVKDMVRQFRQLPPFLANQMAAMFGMDEDTFILMAQGLEKFEEMDKKRKEMAADAGVDAEAAAKAAVEYNNILNTTLERFSLLKAALGVALLEPMKEAANYADQFLLRLTKAVALKDSNGFADLIFDTLGDIQKKNLAAAAGSQVADGTFTLDRGARGDEFTFADYLRGYGKGGRGAGRAAMVGAGRGFVNNYGGGVSKNNAAPPSDKTAEMFQTLEEQYGLPEGVLDALWAQESSRGRNMVSPNSSSRGHFQMIKSVRKQYGVTDPYNLDQSAVGAAEMMRDLLDRNGNDVRAAVRAWNGGEPGSRYLGTDANNKYTDQVMNRIEQNMKFEIHGSNANEIANTVAERLDITTGNTLRDLKGAGQ